MSAENNPVIEKVVWSEQIILPDGSIFGIAHAPTKPNFLTVKEARLLFRLQIAEGKIVSAPRIIRDLPMVSLTDLGPAEERRRYLSSLPASVVRLRGKLRNSSDLDIVKIEASRTLEGRTPEGFYMGFVLVDKAGVDRYGLTDLAESSPQSIMTKFLPWHEIAENLDEREISIVDPILSRDIKKRSLVTNEVKEIVFSDDLLDIEDEQLSVFMRETVLLKEISEQDWPISSLLGAVLIGKACGMFDSPRLNKTIEQQISFAVSGLGKEMTIQQLGKREFCVTYPQFLAALAYYRSYRVLAKEIKNTDITKLALNKTLKSLGQRHYLTQILLSGVLAAKLPENTADDF